MSLTLGLIDVYRVLGSVSSQLQTVQQFPWERTKKQLSGLERRQLTPLHPVVQPAPHPTALLAIVVGGGWGGENKKQLSGLK